MLTSLRKYFSLELAKLSVLTRLYLYEIALVWTGKSVRNIYRWAELPEFFFLAFLSPHRFVYNYANV